MAGAGPTIPATFRPGSAPYDAGLRYQFKTPKTWFPQDNIILNDQAGICQHYTNLVALTLSLANLNFFACSIHGIKVSQFTSHCNSKYIFSAYFVPVSVQSILVF